MEIRKNWIKKKHDFIKFLKHCVDNFDYGLRRFNGAISRLFKYLRLSKILIAKVLYSSKSLLKLIWLRFFGVKTAYISNCLYGLILETKNLEEVITEDMCRHVKEQLSKERSYKSKMLIDDVTYDNIHLYFLISIQPELKLDEVASFIRVNTNFYLKKRFPSLKKQYPGNHDIWSKVLYVYTIGVNNKPSARIEYLEYLKTAKFILG